MTLGRPILLAPDPLLKAKSRIVPIVDDKIRELMDQMLATMYAAMGIGLAAIQIGERQRIVTIDLGRDEEKKDRKPLYFVNPVIEWRSSSKIIGEEGCLSLPEILEDVERHEKIRLSYLDCHGQKQTCMAEGMLSICLQHEIDHLDGILILDRISRVKRDIAWRKLRKAKKLATNAGQSKSATGK